MSPIKAPRMMTMPMLANVPENPALLCYELNTVIHHTRYAEKRQWKGKPTTMASRRDVPIKERNGWIFHLEIATIISTIARKNVIKSGMPVIR